MYVQPVYKVPKLFRRLAERKYNDIMSSDESFSDCSNDNEESDGDVWISEDGDGWISEESIDHSTSQSSSSLEEADEGEHSGEEEDEEKEDIESDEESLHSVSTSGTEEDEEMYHSVASGEEHEDSKKDENLSDTSVIEDGTSHEQSEDLESCEWSTDYGEYYQRHDTEYEDDPDYYDPDFYNFSEETTEDEEPEDRGYSYHDFFPSDEGSYINLDRASAFAKRESARTEYAGYCFMMVCDSAEVQGKTESIDGEDSSAENTSVQYFERENVVESILVEEPESKDVVFALEEVEFLGAGNFGQVFKMSGLWNGKRRMFAEKRMSITDPSAKNEQKMLESVSHRHIISYIQSYTKADQLIVLMEFADRGTLTQMVEDASRDPSQEGLFEEHNIWRFINHMSCALNYLHVLNILHRDLKVTYDLSLKMTRVNGAIFQPDNILGVTKGGRARLKLADFGTAKLLDEDKVGRGDPAHFLIS